jgi:hypothetical protein
MNRLYTGSPGNNKIKYVVRCSNCKYSKKDCIPNINSSACNSWYFDFDEKEKLLSKLGLKARLDYLNNVQSIYNYVEFIDEKEDV